MAKLPPRYNVGPVLDRIKSEHKIDVPDVFLFQLFVGLRIASVIPTRQFFNS